MLRFKLILGLLLISSSAYAGNISIGTISADATTGGFNDNYQTIANVINGNIEGSTDSGATVSNIKADSVFAINMGDDANPQVRDGEILGITVDSFTSGSLTQRTLVYSGCTPATDSDLTSDISACVVYVNGYRVSKGATAQTYTASKDTYVDISQTGVYTLTAVSIGATQPSVAANSARIAKVVTDATTITTVTDLANRRLPGLVIPINYRDGLVVSKDSATTITVLPGIAEVNNSMLSKTATTTLTLGTAGDWAGGSSLAAADTFGFVGLDASGNLKLHTTAPTHDNYAVSTSTGKKRYATWSSTVYRILGWFYMVTSSNVYNASNIKEGGLSNTIMSNDNNLTTITGSAAYSEVSKIQFYNSGGNILLMGTISADTTAGINYMASNFRRGSTTIVGSGSSGHSTVGGTGVSESPIYLDSNQPQGTGTYSIMVNVDTGATAVFRRRALTVQEQ